MYEFKNTNVTAVAEPPQAAVSVPANLPAPAASPEGCEPGQWPRRDCLGLFECCCVDCELWTPVHGVAYQTWDREPAPTWLDPRGYIDVRLDRHCGGRLNRGHIDENHIHYCRCFEPIEKK